MITLLILLLALIFACLSTAGVPELPRLHYLPAAVALLILAWLLSGYA